ncbi:MAG: DUF6502 family protein [Xanthomonadales bacterium]|nr:DUF6502 family protein [Xanthomonadales bacterium]
MTQVSVHDNSASPTSPTTGGDANLPCSSTQLVPGARSEVIIKAAFRMACVFVRLFSPYLQIKVLVDLVTQAGVESAAQRCKKDYPKKKVTLSKLSIMTGIPTAKVKEIQQQPKLMADYHVCAEAAILARWSKDPALRSETSDEPADLPIFGNDGSFQGLVGHYAGRGVSTPTVLERMVETGNIKVVNKHFVRLMDPHWRFFEDEEDKLLDYGTQALSSLANTIAHNIAHRHEGDHKLVERRVCSMKVENTQETHDKLNRLLLKQKEEMLELMKSLECADNDQSPMILGAGYYFINDQGSC